MSLRFLQREQCALTASAQHQGLPQAGMSVGLFQRNTEDNEKELENSSIEQSSPLEEVSSVVTSIIEAEQLYKKLARRIKRNERKLVRLLQPQLPKEFFQPETATNAGKRSQPQSPQQQSTPNNASFFAFGNLLTMSREKLLAAHLLVGELPSIPEELEEDLREDDDCDSSEGTSCSTSDPHSHSSESASFEDGETSDISWTSGSSLDSDDEEAEQNEDSSSSTKSCCSTCEPQQPKTLSMWEQDDIKRALFDDCTSMKQNFWNNDGVNDSTPISFHWTIRLLSVLILLVLLACYLQLLPSLGAWSSVAAVSHERALDFLQLIPTQWHEYEQDMMTDDSELYSFSSS